MLFRKRIQKIYFLSREKKSASLISVYINKEKTWLSARILCEDIGTGV